MRQSILTRASRTHLLAISLCLAIAALAGAGRADSPFAPVDLSTLQQTFVQLADKVRPAVVSIRTYKITDRESLEGARIPLSQGSGFIIDPAGFIATNRHVIDDADAVTIRVADRGLFEAKIVGQDPRSDLAVLQIDALDLPCVRWGDLTNVKVNQFAFACGNPFGLANHDGRASITFGVISALGRQMTSRLVGDSEVEYYGNLVETSAPINPGNSGGPLFNIDGEVIGVVTAIETSTGVSEGHGFAIPIDKNTRRILATLKAGQEVRYGFLGIEVQEVEQPTLDIVVNSRHAAGAQVREIKVPNGPAAQAGLKPRDIVLEFDGVPVENSDHLVRMVGFTPVGTEAEVTFLRSGVKRRTTVKIGDRNGMLNVAAR